MPNMIGIPLTDHFVEFVKVPRDHPRVDRDGWSSEMEGAKRCGTCTLYRLAGPWAIAWGTFAEPIPKEYYSDELNGMRELGVGEADALRARMDAASLNIVRADKRPLWMKARDEFWYVVTRATNLARILGHGVSDRFGRTVTFKRYPTLEDSIKEDVQPVVRVDARWGNQR